VLHGRANGEWTVRSLADFLNTYPGTITEKAGEGDLDKGGRRDGRSGYDLGVRFMRCDGGIDERPREEVFPASLSLLSPAKPKSRGS
jgi:hypothetical protein